MRIQIWSITILFLIFLNACSGITDELTPKQRCYKKRDEAIENTSFRGACRTYILFQGLHDSLPLNERSSSGSAVEIYRNTNLLYCLYEVQSRIDCEKLGYLMKSIYELDTTERTEVMKLWEICVYMLLLIFFSSCDGIADRFQTPKQRCYKKRDEAIRNSPWGGDCKFYMVVQAQHDILLKEGKIVSTPSYEGTLNTVLFSCLNAVQSRIKCEKQGY